MSDDWIAERNEVLERDRDGTLWHVRARLKDIDTGTHVYELADDTHTSREFWIEEDVEDCFSPTGAAVLHARKPRQVLDGRLYDDETE